MILSHIHKTTYCGYMLNTNSYFIPRGNSLILVYNKTYIHQINFHPRLYDAAPNCYFLSSTNEESELNR